MADYTPPTENLPIFDKLLFSSGEEYITQNDADKRYLRYPNAQGKENLQSILVGGVADFADDVNIDGEVTIENTLNANGINNYNGAIYCAASANFNGQVNVNSTSIFTGTSTFNNTMTSTTEGRFNGTLVSLGVMNIIDTSLSGNNKIAVDFLNTQIQGTRMRLILCPNNGQLNPYTVLNDILWSIGSGTQTDTTLSLCPVSAITSGIKIKAGGTPNIQLGVGGTTSTPTNRINISATAFQLFGGGTNNNITFNNNILMTNSDSSNRQITTSFLKLTDVTSNTPTVQIYGSGSNIAMDNNIIMSNASSSNRQITSSYLNVTDISSNTLVGQIYGNGSNINFSKNILMNGPTGPDRQITTSYLNLTDITTGGNVCQIYGGGTGAIFDNNKLDGSFLFATDDSLGVQSVPLQFSSGAFNIGTTASPTYTGAIPPTSDNSNKIPTTQWVQSLVSPVLSGRTQTVTITTSQTIVVPTGVIGIGIRMIAKGGIPGLNADTGFNYSSGGTGGGGSSLVSNGMVPIIGGSTIYSLFVSLSVSLRYFSTIFCTCPTGNNGGDASGLGGVGGPGAPAQTGGSGTPGYGSFTLFPGNAGVNGISNQGFGSITGVPTIAASSSASSTGFQGFTDSLPGCGQRYKFISGNGYINSSPEPGPAIIYLTYYYI
jgi:hypothetical protein